jgi:hypothetical protein
VCANCGDKEEVQFESERILLGYIYSSGAAHFSHMATVNVPGLVVASSKEELRLSLGGRVWSLKGEAQPGVQRDGFAAR